VTVARTNGTDTVIASGLKPGETVVTDGQLRLVAGSKVSIKSAGAAAKVTP
jgi:multidrug efflux system membrane fusion protein